ncbi:MAG: hypothetical protein V2A34_00600 [Lentisphaerota bacterium]
MPESERPLRVFPLTGSGHRLCHSSGDKPAVRELYQKLAVEGRIDFWMDEERLFP